MFAIFQNPPVSLLILFDMDPRPYNYEFRRPRPNNPTYQSYNAYDSLYHMGKKDYFITNNILRDEYSQRMNLYSPNLPNPYQRNSPPEVPSARTERQSVRYDEIGVNTDSKNARTNSNYSSRSRSSVSSNPNNAPQTGRASVLSTYGSNSLDKKDIAPVTMRREQANIVVPHNSTSDIYIKQQRPFNIINMSSKHSEPLRKFPKLTREHLLYEQGMDLVGAE